jgi:hypothetical protein
LDTLNLNKKTGDGQQEQIP